MADTQEFELIVDEGNKPLIQRIIAAVFFAIMLISIFSTASPFFFNDITEELCLRAAHSLESIFYCFAGGVCFSLTKTVMIDTDKNKLISRYSVGPFSRRRLSEVPQLEYVAVFKNAKEVFEVNLWYKGNKHYKMYVFQDKNAAMLFARKVATKLQLDLLDATEKGNSKWIESTE